MRNRFDHNRFDEPLIPRDVKKSFVGITLVGLAINLVFWGAIIAMVALALKLTGVV